MSKTVSFLIPSRGRLKGLKMAMESIGDTADDHTKVEIVVRLDRDDIGMVSGINSLPSPCDTQIMIGKRLPGGYLAMADYYRECYETSKGQFLFIFNDDTVMISKGWDTILEKYIDVPCVFDPAWNHDSALTTFPIVNRLIPEMLGEFCKDVRVDQWFHYLAQDAGCLYSARGFDTLIKVNHLAETDQRHEFPKVRDLEGDTACAPPLDRDYLKKLSEKLKSKIGRYV